jgi:hypothetical protein
MAENTTPDPSAGPSDTPAPSAFAAALERRLADKHIVQGRRCLYVRDQLILSDLASLVLREELGAIQGQLDREHPFLDELGLQLWNVATQDGESLVVAAARLQSLALARVEEIGTGREADALYEQLGKPGGTTGERRLLDPVIVSLNHVFVGQPTSHGQSEKPPAVTLAQRVLEPGSSDTDCDIAVLDTGVPSEKDLEQWHPELDEALRRDPSNPAFPDDLDTLYSAPPQLRALAGHGTFIAGLVRLVAPDLVLSPYAVLDPDGLGDDVTIARALWHVATRPRSVPVLSLSFGAYTYNDAPPPVVSFVIDRLPRTTVVVAAAGNNGSPRPFYPAASGNVVAVASFDDEGGVVRPTPWTNFGPWVDVCAPGVDLLSTYVVGSYEIPPAKPSDPPTFEKFGEPRPSARWTGTSFSAPLVAAEIARRVRDDWETGTLPIGPLTAEQAWRDLQAELSPLQSVRDIGLEYWPPIDPRTPRQP